MPGNLPGIVRSKPKKSRASAARESMVKGYEFSGW
jgi:hypothetical protein